MKILSNRRLYLLAAIIFSLIFLSACASLNLKPGIEKNYKITIMQKSSHHWESMMAEGEESIHVEEPILRTSDHKKIVRWRKQLDTLKNKPPLEQLKWVNYFVNEDVKYIHDYEHWKKRDKWGFPLETLEEGGDCEDFAMLKIVSLHYLGWSDENLMVLVGYSLMTSTAHSHAILLVTMENENQLLLDSLELDILPPSADHHFQPLFGLTKDHLFTVKLDSVE